MQMNTHHYLNTNIAYIFHAFHFLNLAFFLVAKRNLRGVRPGTLCASLLTRNRLSSRLSACASIFHFCIFFVREINRLSLSVRRDLRCDLAALSLLSKCFSSIHSRTYPSKLLRWDDGSHQRQLSFSRNLQPRRYGSKNPVGRWDPVNL